MKDNLGFEHMKDGILKLRIRRIYGLKAIIAHLKSIYLILIMTV